MEGSRLRGKWLDFRRSCAKEDQLDLELYDPSIESVISMVEDVKEIWEAKRRRGVGGKIKTQFHRLSGCLQSHSNMLAVLPESSEYVSIFTGTLNTIIKVGLICSFLEVLHINLSQASVNHEYIADGLSESLLTITQSIATCSADLEMFQTPVVVQHISELYGLVFLFFSTFMDWFMKKRRSRLLDSFNENITQKFDKELKTITQKVDLIRNLVEQGSRAEVRETRLGIDYVKAELDDIRIGLEGNARDRAEWEYYATKFNEELQHSKEERKRVGQLVSKLTQMLRGNAITYLEDEEIRQQYTISMQASRNQTQQLFLMGLPDSHSRPTEWTSGDLALSSAHLEDFFHRDRVRLPYEVSGPIRASYEILQRLADWTANQRTTSAMLWLDGPPTDADDLENPLSVIASHFIDLASRANLPLLSYFCELRRGERLRAGNSSAEKQSLLALVYSLIRQSIENLLPVFNTDLDLSQRRFTMIDGTTSSWNEALSVFRDLLSLMPDQVFCVIDGLHWVDQRDTTVLIHDLMGVLRHEKLKVLWTTTGRAPTLLEELDVSEIYEINRLDILHESGGLYDELFDRSR